MKGEKQPTGRKLFSAYTLNILFILFALIGLALVPRLTVKLNPGRVADALTISFTYPGSAPQVVEHEVTAVLEGALSTLGGIRQIESNSSFGYGYIVLETERGTNIETLRFHILSLIKDVWQHLPAGVGYPEISAGRQQNTDKQLLISYTLNGNVSTYELKTYAEKHIQQVINEVNGISGIETHGATPYEWHFKYNSERLRQYGLTPSQLSYALMQWQEVNGVGASNTILADSSKVSIPVRLAYARHSGLDTEWKNIPLANLKGTIIHLGDVAEMEIVQQQPDSYFRINGKNTVSINVYATPVSNQIALANEVYKAEQKVTTHLPPGWNMIKMYDSSEYLRREIGKTSRRIAAAIVLLLLFVLLVQRSFRYLLLITVSLTVNIAIAVIFYYLFHVEIHLVSIAGITVSIGIIIDNYIMMTDYMLHRKSLNVFMAMLGATLTTLGALVVIFFLDESDRANLVDFALVIIINLAVSLTIALLFIPSLMSGMNLAKNRKPKSIRRLKRVAFFNRIYGIYIKFAHRWRWAFLVVIVLAFGLPMQLLPTSVDENKPGAAIYNNTLGSRFYGEHLRSPLEKTMGGSLRLFMNHASGRSNYYQPSGETTLYIRISLPTGTTIAQLNEVCLKMEGYLAQFPAIRQFQARVNGPQSASIVVYFKEVAQNTWQPGEVKSFMIQKANEFAGADFGIYLRNETFSNELSDGWRSSRIQLSGYDYRELISLAQSYSDTLRKNPRIADIAVYSGNDQFQQTSTVEEKGLIIDKHHLAMAGMGYLDYINALQQYTAGPTAQAVVSNDGNYTRAQFFADDLEKFDLWQLMHTGMGNDSVQLRPAEVAQLATLRVDGNIYKKDQSYLITLAYNFIGPDELGRKVLERETKKMSESLPLGYKAEVPKYDYSWMFGEKPMQYWLLGLIVIIIWALGAILFESLLQPFVVISIIPLSFIGAFFTFYHFDIAFDEGGYASLLLLSGLSVNMVIYIINDLNVLRKTNTRSNLSNYLKAFNLKIVPVFLTTISTILGLLPFLLFDGKTSFWTAFAAGTIGGLVFSVPMLILYLPLLIKMKFPKRRKRSHETLNHPQALTYGSISD
ncbi:MAG: efflux RND transporter permease subunit [Lentimicrobiaceae bacterium]|nr:efflux RND transporter permease subunit [Lentimicrobiaceae bacterium]